MITQMTHSEIDLKHSELAFKKLQAFAVMLMTENKTTFADCYSVLTNRKCGSGMWKEMYEYHSPEYYDQHPEAAEI
ncbi:MAG: hypothetical protein KBT02_11835 [Treponema sp.]|nr:hypothetical protein [Candidatus Treponema caballi]